MGELTRNYPWENTILGHPDTWPQSLRTTLSILLNSRFPMFLWWSKELLCFYNDAYRPSMGVDGKHPGALGQLGAVIWEEAWDLIGPQVDQVMSGGGPTWDEDRLVPIWRNGRMEDVYWTYGYTPVIDEYGEINGVLVTCTETTEKVKQYLALRDTKNQLEFAIDAANLGTWDLNPVTNTFRGNDRLRSWFGLSGEGDIPLEAAIASIAAEDRDRVVTAIQRALEGENNGIYDIIYNIKPPGKSSGCYVKALGKAVFNEAGKPVRFNGTMNDITLEVIAERTLRQSESNFRALVLNAPVAMCVLKGPAYIVEIANSHILELWGKPADVMLGRPLFEGLPEVRNQGLEALLENVYYTGEHYVAKERPVSLPRNGKQELFYVNFTYEPMKDTSGNIIGIMVVAYDVTHSTEQRLAMKDAEERSRLAMEVSELGSYDVNLLTNAMIASPRMEEIFGFGNDPSRYDYLDAVYWEDLPIRNKAYEAAMRTGELFYEIRIIHPDKSLHWIRAKGRVYFDQQKTPVRLLGAIMDITDQKIRVDALEESNKRFRLIADAMPQLVWIADTNGKVVYYNTRIQEYQMAHTVTPDGGYYWHSIVHPDDLESTDQLWKDAVAGRADYVKEHRILMKDGAYRWHLSRAIAERNINGDVIQWYGTATEIDAIKKAQEAIAESEATLRQQVEARTYELATANNQLRQTNQELEQFAYIASHDLQEPLRKMRTFAGMIKRTDDLSAKYLDKIEHSAARMSTLIQDVLHFSRLSDAGTGFQLTDMEHIWQQISADFELLIAEKEAILSHGPLPQLEVVPFQVNQLFANLISNALKFSKEGTTPRISLTAEKATPEELLAHFGRVVEKAYCVLTFSDNGIGFKQDHADKIFKIFQRLHSKDEYSGTGIGLAICKKIVHNHHGSILALSSPGNGAVFQVLLPYTQ